MRESSFKGKQVKNYTMEQILCQLEGNTFVIDALKDDKIPVSIYAIPHDQIKSQHFTLYNNAIAQNYSKVFPQVKQVIRSQKNIYMIFEKLKKKTTNANPAKILQQILFLFKFQNHKINKEQLFINEKDQLKYLPSFFKGGSSIANLYSKFHNKSILIDFFTDLFAPYQKNQLTSFLLEKWESQNLLQDILKKLNYRQEQPKHNNKSILKPNIYPQPNKQQQIPSLYPSFEDQQKQFMALMSDVRVNPSLAQEAGDHFRRTSQRVQCQQSKEIKNLMDNVKSSMFQIKKVKDSSNKSSKYQLISNESKLQKMEFEAYYKAYTQSFKLLKQTIKSYLKVYSKGFAGVISAFFLTLIGILRRLRLIQDLQVGIDIFQIGQKGTNHQKQITELKRELKPQAKRLATLKNIIQTSDIPFHTYQILVPYLQEWDDIDPEKLQNFAFFYFSILHRKHFKKDMHSILTIQTLHVLLNRDYEIVYSQEDSPKHWDEHYYQMKKTLIETLVPKFKVL